jgi:hypothetical protein
MNAYARMAVTTAKIINTFQQYFLPQLHAPWPLVYYPGRRQLHNKALLLSMQYSFSNRVFALVKHHFFGDDGQ